MKTKIYLLLYLIFFITGIVQILGGLSMLIACHNWNLRVLGAAVIAVGMLSINFGVFIKKNGKK